MSKKYVGYRRASSYFQKDERGKSLDMLNEKGLNYFRIPRSWREMRRLAPASNQSRAMSRLRNALIFAEDMGILCWNRETRKWYLPDAE